VAAACIAFFSGPVLAASVVAAGIGARTYAPAVPPAQVLSGLTQEIGGKIEGFSSLFDETGRLRVVTPALAQAHIADMESLAKKLDALRSHRGELDAQSRVDLGALRLVVQGELHAVRDNKVYLTQTFIARAPHAVLASYLDSVQKMPPTVRIWEQAVVMAEQIPAYLRQIQENARAGIKEGHVPLKSNLEEYGIPESETAMRFFMSHFEKLTGGLLPAGEDSAERRERARKAAAEAAQAYAALVEFFKTDVLPAAKAGDGLGEEEYAWQLRNYFGVKKSPAQLSRKGLALAGQIRQEMEALAKKIDPSQDMAAVMSGLEKDHPADDSQLLAAYEQTVRRVQDFTVGKRLFNLPEKFQLKVEALPDELRNRIPIAAYNPEDGTFVVALSKGDPQQLAYHNFYRIPSIAGHEGFPGHALQFYMFKQNDSSTPARRLLQERSPYPGNFNHAADFNFEGYAFYTEELLRRNGFYNAKEELMNLSLQLLRAYRLAVDPAIHAGSMTLQEAAQTISKGAFMPLATATAEVDRYWTTPTQAITYMLGRIQIEKLKAEYKRIMGRRFSEAAFHESFFSFGPVPPTLIAEVMLDAARAERTGILRARLYVALRVALLVLLVLAEAMGGMLLGISPALIVPLALGTATVSVVAVLRSRLLRS